MNLIPHDEQQSSGPRPVKLSSEKVNWGKKTNEIKIQKCLDISVN
jgi:hypothetical protein